MLPSFVMVAQLSVSETVRKGAMRPNEYKGK